MTFECRGKCLSIYKDITVRSAYHKDVYNSERFFCRVCSVWYPATKVPSNRCPCCNVKMAKSPRRGIRKEKFKQRLNNKVIITVSTKFYNG